MNIGKYPYSLGLAHLRTPTVGVCLQTSGGDEAWGQLISADIAEVIVISDYGDLTLADGFLHPMAIIDSPDAHAGPLGTEGPCPTQAEGVTRGAEQPPPRIGGPSSRVSHKVKRFVSLVDEKRREVVEEAIVSAVVLLHATLRSARLLQQRGMGPDSVPIDDFTAVVNVSTSLAVLVPLDDQERRLPAADKAALHDLRLAQEFPLQADAASAHDLRIAPFKVVSLAAAIEWAHCIWSRSLPSRRCKGHPVLGRYVPLAHGEDLGLCEDSPLLIFMLQPHINEEELSRRLPAHSEDTRGWLAAVVNSGMHKAHLQKNNRPSRALTSAIGGAPVLRELQKCTRFRHRGVRCCAILAQLQWACSRRRLTCVAKHGVELFMM